MMYFDEPIISRFGLPKSMCSCPNCGRTYGTRLTGERVEVSTQFCERCFGKEYSEKMKTACFMDCDSFIANFS